MVSNWIHLKATALKEAWSSKISSYLGPRVVPLSSMAAVDLAAARDIRRGHIDDSQVPGTIHLIDVEHTIHTKRSKAQRDIILVPTPSGTISIETHLF